MPTPNIFISVWTGAYCNWRKQSFRELASLLINQKPEGIRSLCFKGTPGLLGRLWPLHFARDLKCWDDEKPQP